MSKDQSGNKADALSDDDAPVEQTSFVGFLLPVVIVAALLGGGLFVYRNHVETKAQVAEISKKARDKLKKHDYESLKQAKKLYEEMLALDSDYGPAIAAMADVNFQLHMHGDDTLGAAEQFLQQAAAENVEHPSRYAISAFVDIAKDNPSKAEADLKGLFDQGKGSSSMAHAYGKALANQGKFTESNRPLKTAVEGDFSAIAIKLTMAEIANRKGEERSAIRTLEDVIRDNANPAHNWARGYLAALRLQTYGSILQPAKHIDRLKKASDMSKRAKAMLLWSEGELALSLLNPKDALAKAEEVIKMMPDYPPFHEFKARAQLASPKRSVQKEGIETYRKAVGMKPMYRGFKWRLAKELSKRKDDAALALVDEVEKSIEGFKGPEYELFRGEHYFRKGDLEQAKAHFTKAADLGDDPDILFGLARVTFEEEKKKGKKADIEKVSLAFSQAVDKKKFYPEIHAYLGKINLWNYLVEGADASFKTSEQHYKKLKRPVHELVAFYDATIKEFRAVKERKLRKKTAKLVKEWRAKKKEYMATLISQ